MVLPTGGRKPGIPGQSRNELTDRILALNDFRNRVDPGDNGSRYDDITLPVSFSIAWTGARKNDPSFDNIDAINAAISSVHDLGGGEVVIPHGIWYVAPSGNGTKFIKMRDNVTLRGAGWGSRIKVIDDCGDYEYLFSGPEGPSSAVTNIAFDNFVVDHNASGNTTCDVDTATGQRQNTFRFDNVAHVEFRRIKLDPYTGTNPFRILGASNQANTVSITDGYYRFERGVTDSPRYDTSTIYASCYSAIVTGNMFAYNGDSDEYPEGAIEIHGPMQIVSNNIIENFGVGTWIVAHTSDALDKGTLASIVTENIYIGVGVGIGSFPASATNGNDEILIADNIIHLDTAAREYRTTICGIMLGDGSFAGDIRNVFVHDNIVYFTPGDTRTTATGGGSIRWNLGGIRIDGDSLVQNVVVHHNTVHNAPGTGLRLNGGAGVVYEDVWVHHNTLIDCAANSNVSASDRASIRIVGSGDYVRTVVEDNRIIDTGEPSVTGQYAWNISTMSGTHTDLTFRRNTQRTVSGPLSTILTSTGIVKTEQASASLNFPSITAQTCAELTVTCPGAAPGDTAWATPANGIESNLSWSAYVSAADTITVRVCNPTGSPINPADRTWYVGYQKRQA